VSLNQFLTVLRRRARWVVSVFVLCLVAAVVLSAFLPRQIVIAHV